LIVVGAGDEFIAVGIAFLAEGVLNAVGITLLTLDEGVGAAGAASAAAATSAGLVCVMVVMVQVLPTLTWWQWLSVLILVVKTSWWAWSMHMIKKLEEGAPERPSRSTAAGGGGTPKLTLTEVRGRRGIDGCCEENE
jgi:hypothetical protein